MKKAAIYSMMVFGVVAVAGTWMRAMPWWPSALPFENLRHAHSHLGFLGWLFSAYVLVLLRLFLPEGKAWSRDKQLWFYGALITALLMFPAFLFGGYTAPAITLLTLHTGMAYVLLAKIWKQTKLHDQPSAWFLKAAILFFLLSSLGPFAIPFIQVFGDGNPVSVRLAVHFYLHFQYSGWFVFGFLAMLYRWLEMKHSALPRAVATAHLLLTATATLPLYLLTAPRLNETLQALYDKLSWMVDAAPWWQLAGTALFIFFARRRWHRLQSPSAWMGGFAIAVLAVKALLEWMVFLPPFGQWVDLSNHFLVLTYLHLLFLGMATPAVWWMFGNLAWLRAERTALRWCAGAFIPGFVLTEGLLLTMGLGSSAAYFAEGLLAGAILMLTGVAAMLTLQLMPTKSSLPQAKQKLKTIENFIAAGELKKHDN